MELGFPLGQQELLALELAVVDDIEVAWPDAGQNLEEGSHMAPGWDAGSRHIAHMERIEVHMVSGQPLEGEVVDWDNKTFQK